MATRELLAHDPNLRAVLSLIGAHFVDIYFNHVYTSARNHVPGGSSLTNEYARQVGTYIIGVKSDKRVYKDVVKNLHHYFQSYTQYESVTFGEFVDTVIGQFVPKEYYKLLTPEQKDEFLSSALCDLVAGLGAYMTTPDLLIRVIDHHDSQAQVTIGMAQQHATALLMKTRGATHNKFLRQAGQAKDAAPVGTVTKLVEQIKKMAHEKAQLQAKIRELEDEIAILREQEQKFRKLFRLFQTERARGIDAAVAQHMTPPAYHKIGDFDPRSAYSQAPPFTAAAIAGRNMISELDSGSGAARAAPEPVSSIAGRNLIAETPAGGARVDAGFFAAAPMDLSLAPTAATPAVRREGPRREPSRYRRGGKARAASGGKDEPSEDEVRPGRAAGDNDAGGLGDFIEVAGGSPGGRGSPEANDLLEGLLDESSGASD